MTSRRRWRSFNRKLPLLASGLVILTAAVLALVTHYMLERTLMNAAADRLQRTAVITASLLTRPGLRPTRLTSAEARRTYVEYIRGRASAQAAQKELERPTTAGEGKLYAALLDTVGRPLVEYRREQLVPPRWPAEAIRRGEIHGDSVAISPLEALGESVGYSRVRALLDSTTGRPVGYLLTTFPFSSSTAQEFRDIVGPGVQVLVGQPGAGVWTDLARVTGAPPLRPSADTALVLDDVVVASVRIPGTSLFVWMSQPRTAIAAPVQTLLWSMLPLAIAIALIGAVLMYGMARRITHPLAQLTDIAEGVARDTHSMPQADEIPADIRGADEITRLRFAFERMADRVAERAALEQQLRHGQKMEAVGRLAGGVAHDFNNLLTAIRSYADLMLDDMTPFDPKRGDVMEIRKAAERAAALTSQLLAFSRKSLLQPRVLDTRSVLDEVHGMLRRLMVEDVRLEIAAPAELWPVKADRGQLEQVIVNLAVNARDAMPDGGTLRISAANEVLVQPVAYRHESVPPGEYVAIRVSDTGVGMDTTTQNRVFEPFFTTKPVGQGTGLGLATVHGIVAQSGGHVTVDSQPSRGTTFTVFLPRALEKPSRDSGSVAANAKGNNETVLLVEDEASVRALARRVLVRAGFRVIEAGSPLDALRLAQAHAKEIRLVLSDVVMPEMSGPQLVAKMAEILPLARVLYISGYTDDEVIGRGLANPGLMLLQKPFSAQQLVERVRDAIDARA